LVPGVYKEVIGMKKLIVYETKTGTTENCAMKIKADMDFQDVEVINLKAGNKPDLSNYDTIIVGTPIIESSSIKSSNQKNLS
jgi:menaquinone-dependent protoporphyrinogen IX oxidase